MDGKEERMRKRVVGLVVATGVSLGLVTGCSNAVERRAAKPDVMERISQESLTGEVVDIGERHVSVRDSSGETTRVRVDDRTKMDVVHPGDRVTAYIDEAGYASTLRREAR